MAIGKTTTLITLLLITLAGLQGCSEPPETEQQPLVRLVKTLVITPNSQLVSRQLPGVIDANQTVKMSFRVSGKLQSLLVKEGQIVEQGQVLAQLDPRDYQIIISDRQANFQVAEANFKRAQQLLPKGHISKTDYDRLEAGYKSARAALNDAQQKLEYTTLKAPFSGRIAQRLVHNFEEIQPNMPVLILQDLSSLEVKIDVPEQIIRQVRENSNPSIYATFLSAPQRQIPLQIKEYSTSADPQTQTFRVTLKMERQQGMNVLPGMTTSVTLNLTADNFNGQPHDKAPFLIPSTAIFADSHQQPNVWVVDQQSMTISARPIKVGALHNTAIEITEGIAPQERIVVAGVSFLAEGQKVALMPEVEQAEPLVE